MLSAIALGVCMCLVQASAAPQAAGKPSTKAEAPASTKAPSPVDAELAEKLLKAKRIYVESFGEDNLSKTLQAMVVDALRSSKRFIVTENKDKADLIMKGSSLEKTSQEFHALGSGTSVAAAAGGHSATVSGSASQVGKVGAAAVSGSSSGGFVAHSLGIDDSQASTETINDARVAVRLVSTDGDVVWSTTQESKGAKYKGASADVADKIVKQLVRDLEKLSKTQTGEK